RTCGARAAPSPPTRSTTRRARTAAGRRASSRTPGGRDAASGRLRILAAGEHVARAAHGADAPRPPRVVLDGGADARDVDVDRAVERLERRAPHAVHQRVAR